MADPARPRALIVEDERPIRELVRLHLELGGVDVDESGDGTGGPRATEGQALRPGPHGCDALPGLDGVTLCGALRSAGPNRETPV